MWLPKRNPWAPEWLVSKIGVDWFDSVARVALYSRSEDEALASFGLLKELGRLQLVEFRRAVHTDRFLERLGELNRIDGFLIESSRTNPISDAGIEHLESLGRLRMLAIDGSRIDDAGLKRLSRLKQLELLFLFGSEITDAGLAHLKSLPRLKQLVLSNSKVSGRGLEHFQGLKDLVSLSVAYSPVDDAGVENLRGLNQLRYLDLEGTKISDVGLETIKGFTNLEFLRLRGTCISPVLAKLLRKDLPDTVVDWPNPSPNIIGR
jgi:hypothetical protein